jgi:hypothetical protein
MSVVAEKKLELFGVLLGHYCENAAVELIYVLLVPVLGAQGEILQPFVI